MSQLIGALKTYHEDFLVEEIFDFDLTGEGEHIWLFIEKNGLNTKDIIRALSQYTGLKQRDIGYSGLKDKHAITRQWFSLYYPGKADIDFSEFDVENCNILRISRHNKKLKIGSHKANRFTLVLRDLTSPFAEIEPKIKHIMQNGFINFFGEQRFGHDNLQQAHDVIDGKIKLNPKDHGFLLSVMRSFLFNAYVQFRQQNHTDQIALIGDIVGFSDGNSVFQVTMENQGEIQQRIESKELSIAAPLIGKQQKLFFSSEALSQYEQFTQTHGKFIDYLAAHSEMQFRSIYAYPDTLKYDYNETDNTLMLTFSLGTGAYATSLVQALSA
ncbi:tRNA pseudouridine(13) synthase TruD [Cysteiniphilum sp. JM-1]|uniref:tRNA pseudouridine(13) synthase TruD n=1 Tax=Cysteiniphilum sp. JM-1 TaxID=2610891 RepID=UPI0012461C97|nr:tRNA pseudouridine(13) synthase TruD [Cysteiniphilum sp. JM-1]